MLYKPKHIKTIPNIKIKLNSIIYLQKANYFLFLIGAAYRTWTDMVFLPGYFEYPAPADNYANAA